MRIIILLCLILICALSKAQIQCQAEGLKYPDDVMFAEMLPDMVSLENVKDTTIARIMLGFRNTDVQSIESYLSPKLKDEIPEIDSLLNAFEHHFHNVDSIHLYENSRVSGSALGTQGRTSFTHKVVQSLSIAYQYYCPKGKTIINQITINGKVFPKDMN